MLTFLCVLKISSGKLPEVNRLLKITNLIVLLFFILNIGVLVVSLSGKKWGYCTEKQPNSIGGLLAKGCLVLFDIMIFGLQCCKWFVKDEGQENSERQESLKYFNLMTSEYLKWTIICFILRVIIDTVLQALLLKDGKIICNVVGESGYGSEWLQVSRSGRIFTVIQVIILVIPGTMAVYRTLFSKLADAGFFGPCISPSSTIKSQIR